MSLSSKSQPQFQPQFSFSPFPPSYLFVSRVRRRRCVVIERETCRRCFFFCDCLCFFFCLFFFCFCLNFCFCLSLCFCL
ncbi:uncharacterized protein DS421_15g490090 [Arachis hypogaea]|nr:uncharacterized protein DS421_15g490090 [Arachis hypogaea]